MESTNEFIYSYLHNISVFYCNDLERKEDMKEDIDLEEFIKAQNELLGHNESSWMWGSLFLLLLTLGGFTENKKEETPNINISIRLDGDK